MTLTQLTYFLEVIRRQSYSRAAKALNVSQPAMSMQIRRLEDELGISLFDRRERRVQLTPIGEAFAEKAKAVKRAVDELYDFTHGVKETVTGPFFLGVLPTLAPYVVPQLLESQLKLHPDLELRIRELQTHDILEQLREERLDAGLVATPLPRERLEATVMFYEPLHAMVADKHPLAMQESVSEAELQVESLITLGDGHCLRHQAIKLCARDNGHPGASVPVESASMELLIELVRRTNGYTIIPQLAAAHLQARGPKLRVLPFAEPQPFREVSLVTSPHYSFRAKLQAVEELLRTSIPAGCPQIKSKRMRIIEPVESLND